MQRDRFADTFQHYARACHCVLAEWHVKTVRYSKSSLLLAARVSVRASDRLKRRVLEKQHVFVETLAVMEVNMQTS